MTKLLPQFHIRKREIIFKYSRYVIKTKLNNNNTKERVPDTRSKVLNEINTLRKVVEEHDIGRG